MTTEDAATSRSLQTTERADYVIATCDADGLVQSWNPAAERVTGWTTDEVLGRHVSFFYPDADSSRAHADAMLNSARQFGAFVCEGWYQRKDGTLFWGDGHVLLLENQKGDKPGFVKFLRDRTAARRQDLEVAALRRRIEVAAGASAAFGAWDYDVATDTILPDAAFLSLFGLNNIPPATRVPRSVVWAAIHPDDLGPVDLVRQDHLRDGGHATIQFRVHRPDGTLRWLESNSILHRDASDNPIYVTGSVIDITDAHNAERAQAALLGFVDQARRCATTHDIRLLAYEIMAEALGASRVGMGDITIGEDGARLIDIPFDWTAEDQASVAGRHDFADFGNLIEDLLQGVRNVSDDTLNDPRTGAFADNFRAIDVHALVNIPVVTAGRLVAVLFVHSDRPRIWLKQEVDFIQTMSERLYLALELHRTEERRTTLSQEVVHRLKNSITVVQGIVTQTLRRADDLESATEQVVNRLVAYGNAQSVLLQDVWEDTDIGVVIDNALKPYSDFRRRISVTGPALSLGSQRVLGLSLACHELLTNAVKHGALSNDAGRITIRWTVTEALVASQPPGFHFIWHELDGPAMTEPSRRGFGTTILTKIAPGYFDGAAESLYRQQGLEYSLDGFTRS